MADLRRALEWAGRHWLTTIVGLVLAVVGIYVFVDWDWFNVEKVKALAALVQAFGVVVAAFLTYRYTRKLERHKFEMRLQEIAHANTHKRKVESLENISKLMGIVVFKLSTVPPFFPEIDPVEPPQDVHEDDFGAIHHDRYRVKVDRYNHAVYNMMEAVEEAYIYIDASTLVLLEKFKELTKAMLEAYFPEKMLDQPGVHERMRIFKVNLEKLKEGRRMINVEFGKQLQTTNA